MFRGFRAAAQFAVALSSMCMVHGVVRTCHADCMSRPCSYLAQNPPGTDVDIKCGGCTYQSGAWCRPYTESAAHSRSWHPIGRGGSAQIRQVVPHPTVNTTLMRIDDNGGVFRTDDGGESWLGRSQSLPALLDVQGVAFVNYYPSTMLLTSTSGLYISSDSGNTWSKPSAAAFPPVLEPPEPPEPLRSVYRIASSTIAKNGTIYVGTGNLANTGSKTSPCLFNAAAKLYRSFDLGLTWTILPDFAYITRCSSVQELVVDPLHAGSVYIVTSSGRSRYNNDFISDPTLQHSSDFGDSFAVGYVEDFSRPPHRPTSISFSATGLTMAMSYTDGTVKIGHRSAWGGYHYATDTRYGSPWIVREIVPANQYMYYENLVLLTQLANQNQTTNTSTMINSTNHTLYASAVNSSFSGLQIAYVNGSHLTASSGASWATAANAWNAQTTGWDSSAWNVTSLTVCRTILTNGTNLINPQMWLTSGNRLYVSNYPYKEWKEKYSSKPANRNSWTSRGADSHSYSYAVIRSDLPSNVLFGSLTDVALMSTDGGFTFQSERHRIQQAVNAIGLSRPVVASTSAIATKTSPNMFLMICLTNLVNQTGSDSAVIIQRHNKYFALNASHLLLGATRMATHTSDIVLLASVNKVYLISGFDAIAHGKTLNFHETEIGHTTQLPTILSHVWNVTLNNTAQANISMTANNPYYFGGSCSNIKDIASCNSYSCPTHSSYVYYILCDEAVYQYSSVPTTVVNAFGYTRQEHWSKARYCNPWKATLFGGGTSEGTACVDFDSTHDAWRSRYGAFLNGGEVVTMSEDFKQVFQVESGNNNTAPATMVIFSNKAVHIQRHVDLSFRTLVKVEDLATYIGWPGAPIEITAAGSIVDAYHGYKVVVALSNIHREIGEESLQANKVLTVTAVQSDASHQLLVTVIDQTEGLGPTHITGLMGDLFAVSNRGAWAWNSGNLVPAGGGFGGSGPITSGYASVSYDGSISFPSFAPSYGVTGQGYPEDGWVWSGGVKDSGMSAVGNFSVSVTTKIQAYKNKITTSDKYRLRGWVHGDCNCRIVMLQDRDISLSHLISSLPTSNASGAWLPFVFDFSTPKTADSMLLEFKKVGTVCNVDQVWLGTVTSDIYDSIGPPTTLKLTESRVLPPVNIPNMTSKTSSTISISWDPVETAGYEPATHYKVEYRLRASTENTAYTLLAEVTADATSATINGLVAGKYYQIRVTAKNVVGYSLPSDLLLVRCDAIAPLVPGIPQLINNPTATEVMLTWTVPTYDGSSPITAYKIYVIDANSITSRAPIQVVETTATVTGLSGGGLYAFRVSAVNAIGESAKSPISNFITTAPSGEGICNVTMRFLKVTTVINYPYGETGLPAHWLDLWKLDMAHTMNISSERIDSVNVYQQQDPLDVNNPITYVTFNVKSSIYSGAKSLVDAKALLLTATVDESSILHQGVASINVDTRFLEFDSTDPGVYEARRALGGNVNRFDENTMQIVGVVVFLIIPSIICLKQIVAEWVQRRDARTAYRDRFD